MEKKNFSGFSIATLILGIIAFLPLIGFIFGTIAMIYGIAAIINIKKTQIRGKSIAIAGLICAISGMLLNGLLIGKIISKTGSLSEFKKRITIKKLNDVATELERYKIRNGRYPYFLQELEESKPYDFMKLRLDTQLEFFILNEDLPYEDVLLDYKIINSGQDYELKSVGIDGKLGTADDLIPTIIKGGKTK